MKLLFVLLSGILLLIEPATTNPGRTTDSGLTIVQLDRAPQLVSQTGDFVYVLYTGKLDDGTIFDSSDKRPDNAQAPTPLIFQLGKGVVIKGFEEGMLGMSVGDRRRLIIPAALGYGDRRTGPIPPDSRLTFEVELVRISRPTK